MDNKKIKNISIDAQNIIVEFDGEQEPIVANHDACNTCAIGAACLVDGPLPDFEVAGVAGVIKVTGWFYT